jgi:hypothetical protein
LAPVFWSCVRSAETRFNGALPLRTDFPIRRHDKPFAGQR